MNKYQRNPDHIIDLHGYTTKEVKIAMDKLLGQNKYAHVRIITGRGIHSLNGPAVKNFIKSYLQTKNIRFTQSKIQDGGEGAFEVFLENNF